MNKRKRVALKKHRTRRKKLEERSKPLGGRIATPEPRAKLEQTPPPPSEAPAAAPPARKRARAKTKAAEAP